MPVIELVVFPIQYVFLAKKGRILVLFLEFIISWGLGAKIIELSLIAVVALQWQTLTLVWDVSAQYPEKKEKAAVSAPTTSCVLSVCALVSEGRGKRRQVSSASD